MNVYISNLFRWLHVRSMCSKCLDISYFLKLKKTKISAFISICFNRNRLKKNTTNKLKLNMENVRHRPGAFKQQNKAHKTGRHRSKGQIDNTNKGKVEVKSLTKHRKQQSRDDRKNRLNQLRKTKREEILNKKRLIGGLNGAPHIVVFCPFHICFGLLLFPYFSSFFFIQSQFCPFQTT